MERFKNKTILIIGASSGIGKQTAVTLSDQGARVLLAARNTEKMESVRDSLNGDGHKVYFMDVSDLDSLERIFKDITAIEGPLDGMVYSAGISKDTPVLMCKPETMKKVFDTNYFGFVECVRQASKKGRFNPEFRVVAVSSIASFTGYKARIAYCSSKAAMNAAVKCMALELSSKGICVNAVAPAVTKTEMQVNLVEINGEDSSAINEIYSRQYLGIAEPIDVANAIAFLLSREARFITGITLPVDGGATTS